MVRKNHDADVSPSPTGGVVKWAISGAVGLIGSVLTAWATGYLTPLTAPLDNLACMVTSSFDDRGSQESPERTVEILVLTPYGSDQTTAASLAETITRRTGFVARSTCLRGGGAPIPEYQQSGLYNSTRTESDRRINEAIKAGQKYAADIVIASSNSKSGQLFSSFISASTGMSLSDAVLGAASVTPTTDESLSLFVEEDLGKAVSRWAFLLYSKKARSGQHPDETAIFSIDKLTAEDYEFWRVLNLARTIRDNRNLFKPQARDFILASHLDYEASNLRSKVACNRETQSYLDAMSRGTYRDLIETRVFSNCDNGHH